MNRGSREGTDLSRALEALTSRLDRKSGGGLLQVRVEKAWRTVSGPSVSAHTTGAHLRGTELLVYVDSPAWATELSALSEKYRVAMNAEIGQEAVGGVRFSVSRRVRQARDIEEQEEQSRESYRADAVESVPLSAAELRQVEASASAIEDRELRETVIRATVADLEWKKGLKAEKGRETPRGEL